MRIRLTEDRLSPSPIPVQSCFFCGMAALSETARALSDADSGLQLGWCCHSCLRAAPSQLQQLLGANMQHIRDHAERLYRQAESMSARAHKLEGVLHELSHPLLPNDR